MNKLFTEQQFDNFQNSRPYVIYKDKTSGCATVSGKTTCIMREIPAGIYGYRIYWTTPTNGFREVRKSVVAINNKTVKENLQ